MILPELVSDKMKGKIITVLVGFFVIVFILTGISIADENSGESIPYFGDGEPDEIGNDVSNGSNFGPGPAPNYNDGVPDGPGW